MKKFNKFFLAIRAIPKTIYINFKYLELKDAIRFPIIVSHRVVLDTTKGSIIIKDKCKFGLIRIGFGEHMFFEKKQTSYLRLEGKITFNGRATIGNGTRLNILGELELGKDFIISSNCQIDCRKKIKIGDTVLIGWDCLIMDTDGHKILSPANEIINHNKEIIIGNKVWIGARCTILKGSILYNNVVIAANSCVTKEILGQDCIIGGYPARIIKENITWKG